MARLRVEITGPAAFAVIATALATWYLLRPPEFRRGLWLEARGLASIVSTYEGGYGNCADERDEIKADLRGLVLGFLGRAAHRFPAENDADAIAFARAARPDCTLFRLARKRRTYWDGGFSLRRPRSTPWD